MKSGMSKFILGATTFLAGLSIGVGAGLLLAPRPGRETRKQLKDLSDEAGEHVGRIRKEAKEVFAGVVKHGKELAGETSGHIGAISGEVKETAARVVEQGKALAR